MLVAGTAAAMIMAAVLLAASVAKLAAGSAPLEETLRRIGAPPPLARTVAPVVPWAELLAGMAIVLRPDLVAARLAVLALATGFAAAALLALRTGEPVPCACFGVGGTLGMPQVVAFFGWLAGVAIISRSAIAPRMSDGAVRLVAIALSIAAVRAVSLLRLWRESRGDRLSAKEMYKWLPSH